jgi:hypothetical protein
MRFTNPGRPAIFLYFLLLCGLLCLFIGVISGCSPHILQQSNLNSDPSSSKRKMFARATAQASKAAARSFSATPEPKKVSLIVGITAPTIAFSIGRPFVLHVCVYLSLCLLQCRIRALILRIFACSVCHCLCSCTCCSTALWRACWRREAPTGRSTSTCLQTSLKRKSASLVELSPNLVSSLYLHCHIVLRCSMLTL